MSPLQGCPKCHHQADQTMHDAFIFQAASCRTVLMMLMIVNCIHGCGANYWEELTKQGECCKLSFGSGSDKGEATGCREWHRLYWVCNCVAWAGECARSMMAKHAGCSCCGVQLVYKSCSCWYLGVVSSSAGVTRSSRHAWRWQPADGATRSNLSPAW